MGEDLDILGAFKRAAQWECAHFLAPLSCSAAEAERRFGIRFPAAYLDLVARLKDQGVEMEDIAKASSEVPRPDWPRRLVPFFADGMGNYYCFDASLPGAAGEPAIVFWDHETSEETVDCAPDHDSSFSAWACDYASQSAPARRPRNAGPVLATGCLVVLALVVIGIITVVRWFWR